MRIFISSVTHDFKIPLNGIMSTNKDLLEKFNDAVLTYYDVPKKEGDLVHNQLNIDGYGTFTLNTVENAIQTV